MGIVNTTPDSFSNDGIYMNSDLALQKVRNYLNEGVDIVDLGAQSTRPGAIEIGAEEEIRRLMPALRAIRIDYPELIISVDTFLSKVAEMALNEGANWINDVSGGLRDPNMKNLIADSNCPYVLMHSKVDKSNIHSFANYNHVVNDVIDFLNKQTDQLLSLGVNPEMLIWDPGIGFSKETKHNLAILRKLDHFCNQGFPVLIGTSRKRFIGEITNEEVASRRTYGTAAVICRCVQAGVSVVRVHDVHEMNQTINMANQLW